MPDKNGDGERELQASHQQWDAESPAPQYIPDGPAITDVKIGVPKELPLETILDVLNAQKSRILNGTCRTQIADTEECDKPHIVGEDCTGADEKDW